MSESVVRSDKPVLSNLWKADDDWTGLKEKEERKKRQNRLNQRAYRMRHASKDAPSKKRQSFRVERFRITEVPAAARSKESAGAVEPPQVATISEAHPAGLESNDSEPLVGLGSTIGPVPETISATYALRSLDFESKEALALLAVDLGDPASSALSLASATYLQHLKDARSTPIVEAFVQAKPPKDAAQVLDGALGALLQSKPLFHHFGCDASPVHSVFHVAASAATSLFALDNTSINENTFPLSSDHLLHLIHFNVFRALISNKLLLNDTTFLLRAGNEVILPAKQNLCEGLTLVRAKPGEPIPRNLYPTTHQMSIAHSSWLNIFPFPRVRDNLIRHQNEFNHQDLCNDLFGELFFKNLEISNNPYQHAAWAPHGSVSDVWESWEDDVTARRKGFIVWGEPWDVKSWEVTPGFLKKWSWILEGCDELIEATNYWRARREEPPLEYVFSGGPTDPRDAYGREFEFCFG